MILASPKNAPKDIQLYEHGLRYNIKPKLIIVYLFPFFLPLMFLLILLFVVDDVDIGADLDVDVD